jgi:hypothetical protein
VVVFVSGKPVAEPWIQASTCSFSRFIRISLTVE